MRDFLAWGIFSVKMKRPVTLHHVARMAGVSHTTVSMALRGDPRIKDSTREKVLEAARALAYVPNAAARSLARGRSNTVAILSSSFSAAYESETLRGIEKEMGRVLPDYRLVQYSTSGGARGDVDALLQDLLYGSRADGVICLSHPPSREVRTAWREHHKPLLVFNANLDDVPVIRGDDYKGARLAAAHLLDRGCLRPGIVHGGHEVRTDRPADPGRRDGFLEVCAERGVEGLSMAICRYHFDEGQRMAADIAREGWDGVFCAAGDMVAIGIMAGLREAGLSVPADIRVVGYDNLRVAAMVSPSLSTIAQPLEDMGAEAVRMIKELLASEELPDPVMVVHEPFLVQRESG